MRHTQPIHRDGYFELSVINSGKPIPPGATEKSFIHLHVNKTAPVRNGLGPGLYIASQIALAHNGELTVISRETETRFTFRLPA